MKFKNFDDFLEYFSILDIKSFDLFEFSIIHSSHKNASKNVKNINQRCEFFGDSILGFIICEILYFTFPDESDGELAKKKSHLASREVANRVAQDICLDQVIKSSDIIKKEKNSVLSCLFESFICCVYIKYGIEKTKDIINIILVNEYLNKNFDSKTKLQEFCQERYKMLPSYELISVSGEDHDPLFKIKIKIKNFEAMGEGKTKKLAQKEAASKLIEQFNLSEI